MKGKLIIAGGSGLIGRALVEHFSKVFNEVVVLTRSTSGQKDTHREVQWDAKSPGVWQSELKDCNVLINLTGKSIECRFTEENQKVLRSSRLDSTRLLSETISTSSTQPDLWLNASGSAYYPPSYDSYTEEDQCTPSNFLGQLCVDWEKALMHDSRITSRRVAMRISPVLSAEGGALAPLKRVAQFGLGGHQGSGKQFFSWIHIQDLVQAVEHIIRDTSINGPVNFCSPDPLTNSAFMKELRLAIGIPFGIPSPTFVMRLSSKIIGIEPELALDSKNILPKRLSESGFKYNFPTIRAALTDLI